jgi:hypothetical protein
MQNPQLPRNQNPVVTSSQKPRKEDGYAADEPAPGVSQPRYKNPGMPKSAKLAGDS